MLICRSGTPSAWMRKSPSGTISMTQPVARLSARMREPQSLQERTSLGGHGLMHAGCPMERDGRRHLQRCGRLADTGAGTGGHRPAGLRVGCPASFDAFVDEVHGSPAERRESAKGISLCGDLPLLVTPACSWGRAPGRDLGPCRRDERPRPDCGQPSGWTTGRSTLERSGRADFAGSRGLATLWTQSRCDGTACMQASWPMRDERDTRVASGRPGCRNGTLASAVTGPVFVGSGRDGGPGGSDVPGDRRQRRHRAGHRARPGRAGRTGPPRLLAPAAAASRPGAPGERYVFLGTRRGHFRRSNHSSRLVRPAAGYDSRAETAKTPSSRAFTWGERGDSNPRHPGPQPGALTN